MILQILVTHYDEDFSVIKPLLDSIALQQSVDFSDIGVIICSDGKKNPLDAERFKLYPYEIQYSIKPHRGVSATRNACLDMATADYVMFCDCDDLFVHACGLYIILREIKSGGFDSLVSVFMEETKNPETGEIVYINHDRDSTFVHGKVHRRQYLIDKHIRWNKDLTIHEDSFFNILCQNLSDNVKLCQTPFYLWKWRDNSICRHDKKYILKTYKNMIDSNDALVDEFTKRGMVDKMAFFTAFLIFDAYYTMNKPEWVNQENKEYRDETESRFRRYYAKRKPIWQDIPGPDKMAISNQVRTRAVGEGMLMEAVTVDEWLKHIEELTTDEEKVPPKKKGKKRTAAIPKKAMKTA